MAIINNCLCVLSLRTGGYISGIYAILYYALHIILVPQGSFLTEDGGLGGNDTILLGGNHSEHTVRTGGQHLGVDRSAATSSAIYSSIATTMPNDEQIVSFQQHIRNDTDLYSSPPPEEPTDGSFIGYDSAKAHMQFMMTVLFPAGILASALVIAGVYWNKRFLFLPWLLIHPVTALMDLVEVLCIFFWGKAEFKPVQVFIFSGYFFLTAINVYSFLCVISQYQELRAGRGRGGCQSGSPTAPVVIYDKRSASQPTTLSAGSTRRTGMTTADGSKATPTPSHSHCNPHDVIGYSPDHMCMRNYGMTTRATAKIYLSPEDAIKMTSSAVSAGGSAPHSLLLPGHSAGASSGASGAVTPTNHPRKTVSFVQPSFMSDSVTDDPEEHSDECSSSAVAGCSVTEVQIPVILIPPPPCEEQQSPSPPPDATD